MALLVVRFTRRYYGQRGPRKVAAIAQGLQWLRTLRSQETRRMPSGGQVCGVGHGAPLAAAAPRVVAPAGGRSALGTLTAPRDGALAPHARGAPSLNTSADARALFSTLHVPALLFKCRACAPADNRHSART